VSHSMRSDTSRRNKTHRAIRPTYRSIRPDPVSRTDMRGSSLEVSLKWSLVISAELRHRLGDAGFRYLLMNTSLFLPVGNNCYMQLSGRPIYELYKHEEEVKGTKRKRGTQAAQRSRKRGRRQVEDEVAESEGKPRHVKPR